MTRRTRRLAGVVAAATALGAPAVVTAIEPDTTILVSIPGGSGPVPPDDVNEALVDHPAASSSDGRRVVFVGTGDGLDASGTDDEHRHCYLRDTATGTTTLLDRASGAQGAIADADCARPTISPDGTAVAFVTLAANLAPGDGNSRTDVYVRDLVRETTFRGSVTGTGGQLGTGGDDPAITVTGDARGFSRRIHVAFTTSDAIDPLRDAGATSDLYVHRTAQSPFPATTLLVSRADGADSPSAGIQGFGHRSSISSDGTRLAFATRSGLDPADTNAVDDIYVRDTAAGTTVLASRATGAAGPVGDAGSDTAQISRNGGAVVFLSRASNLGASHPAPSPHLTNVFVRSLGAATTTPVSVSSADPGVLATASSGTPSISDDATSVAFRSDVSNLVAAPPPSPEVYVRRLTGTPETTIASRADGPAGAPTGRTGPSGIALFNTGASISGDGSTVVFTGPGGGVAPGVRALTSQVYARTLVDGATRLVSRPGGPAAAPFTQAVGDAELGRPFSGTRTVSREGRYVVLSATGTAFSGAADPEIPQVYRRDTATGEVRLVSRTSDGVPGTGASGAAVISADGATVAFASSATNLTGSPRPQVMVWRVATGTAAVVSTTPSGAPGNGPSGLPSISADGGKVAFESVATDLAVPLPSPQNQVWVRDLATGSTELASRARGVAGAPLESVSDSAISADGRRVAFSTTSPDAVSGDAGVLRDVYVRDLTSGDLLRASRPDGADSTGEGEADSPGLNRDGTVVAFTARRPGLTADDPDARADVFVRNLTTGRTILVSRATGVTGDKATADSGSPAVSDDGTRVVFRTPAANLVRDDLNGSHDVFLRDLTANRTIGVTRLTGPNGTLLGSAGAPDLGTSPDLDCVAFTSTRPGLVPGGYRSPDFAQVYLRSVGAPCAAVAGPGPRSGTPGSTARRTLSRATLRPARFRAGAARGRGSTLRFTLSRAGTVTATVLRPRAGRITAGTCRLRQRTGPRCTILTAVARFTVRAPTGTTSRRFTAVFNGRPLSPGRYRLRLAPTGGTPRTVTFRVARR